MITTLPLLCNFTELGDVTAEAAAALHLVGGKARNLAQLTQWSMPVPPGFVLTTEAYRLFVEHNRLDAISDARSDDIQAAFRSGEIPPSLAAEIESAWLGLGSAGAVAVRSSATAEDLAGASFAGGQATVLEVATFDALLDAVKVCWSSLWSERVRAYRRRMQVDENDLALAVVVQRMVAARVSGVAFTVDPVTGDRSRLVVEACFGLGEALVSGQITPDHYELDRVTLQTTAERRGSQGGGACLNRDSLARLGALMLEIEARYGAPQDIEWAFDAADQLHILQARPITTLPSAEAEAEWANPVAGALWVRRGGGGLIEYLPGPPSPLYLTAQLPPINDLHDLQAIEMGVLTNRPNSAVINGYLYNRSDYPLKWSSLLLPVNYWRKARVAARWWREEALPQHLEELAKLASVDVTRASMPELLAHLEALFQLNARAWDTAVRASRAYVFTEPLFQRLYKTFFKPVIGGDAVTFLRGFESAVAVGERAMWELVREALLTPEIGNRIRRNSGLNSNQCAAWMGKFRAWTQEYGHATASHDFAEASAADDPARALETIRIRMELPPSDPAKRQRAMAESREQAERDALRKLARHPLRQRLFTWILRWAQQGAAIREDVFFHALKGWPLTRRAALEAGGRLVAAGALERSDDVFYLTWDELQKGEAACDRKALIAGRRSLQEAQRRLSPPPVVPLEGPRRTLGRRIKSALKQLVVGSGRQSGKGVLRGAPVSPGVVTGPARVLHSTADLGRLQAGDILVTRIATPEWTPAFTLAAGLVTDIGGPLSHSSIVAREFGLPAVMGVDKATQTIADGQELTIDGGEGVVRVHE